MVLSVDKLVQKAEATLHTTGAEIFADADSENLYAAIDSLAHKLDRQVLKHKEKQASFKSTDRHQPLPGLDNYSGSPHKKPGFLLPRAQWLRQTAAGE